MYLAILFHIIAYRTHLGYTFTIIIAVVLSLTIIITVGGCLGLPLALCLLKMHVRVLLSVSLKVYLVNYHRSWIFLDSHWSGRSALTEEGEASASGNRLQPPAPPS